MKNLDMIGLVALILVIVGGINWLLVGLFDVNIVTAIFGMMLGRLIFIIVGAAAVYLCYLLYLDKYKKV